MQISRILAFKNLHLAMSAIIVISVGFIYGLNPSGILPKIFGFQVEDLELKNIFRAIMGLYLATGLFWVMGAINPVHWRTATITNIIFMGGLAFGRLISTLFDGISPQYTTGMILEAMFCAWGLYNLKKFQRV